MSGEDSSKRAIVHRRIVYVAYGWLAVLGTGHFLTDVVSQYLRGVRAPSTETSLYYGLNSSFALGQVVLGALGLWLARRAPDVLREPPALLVSVVAAIAWLAIALLFMEYWQPKMAAATVLVLVLAVGLTARR